MQRKYVNTEKQRRERKRDKKERRDREKGEFFMASQKQI